MRNKFQVVRSVWKLFILVLLILSTFSYAMFQGGFVSWFLFYSFLPFALYAVCLAFYPIGKFSIERHFPKREFHANESLTVTVTLKRNSFYPLLFLIVEDCFTMELSEHVLRKGNKVFLYPGFRKSFSFNYRLEKLPRGEHGFSSLRLVTSDVLGLIHQEAVIESEDKILVYPAYGEWVYKAGENDFEQDAMVVNDRLQRDTTMAVGIREYQPGDRLSWINWKASAKRSEIMMKEFEQSRSQDLLLILDCTPHMFFELLVQYTASIGHDALRRGARVGFMSISEKCVVLPPQGGESSHRQLFYHLAKMKDTCPLSFAQVLSTDRYLLQQKVPLLLVTAQISAELVKAARAFTVRKCPVTIFVIKSTTEHVTALEISMMEMARTRGISVQFVYGPLPSAGMKKAVKE
ncbi:DUF58 domain-containing protein [Bacillus benzoevorans]|uniref:Uncharacterized protein (DUF58 family) n=1 Tax=Bacillus benzoevorans TaxID=1456 RepID=A0A7X0LX01_9BACI|nr:DUF58 domain-containing protein [Bacillus benzoevorans]MBB6447656.1 uncharacterized protein (DUF58 family) [Bacillus benzoevorans]